MSGIEALRWIQLYPDNVRALIGNDMTTPLTYSMWTREKVEKKIKQHKMLRKRNVFNICHINESNEILDNAAIVEKEGYKKYPALIFK